MKNLEQIKKLSKQFADKINPLKVCLFDVDGILTNGMIFWDSKEVGWNRFTSSKDGYGLKLLQRSGIKVGIITGGDSLGVVKRFKENLELDYIFMGNENKKESFLKVSSDGYKYDEIFYMGDELFDLPLLKAAGFSATVRTAAVELIDQVDYVTNVKAGFGAAREVIDIIRYAKNIHPELESII